MLYIPAKPDSPKPEGGHPCLNNPLKLIENWSSC